MLTTLSVRAIKDIYDRRHYWEATKAQALGSAAASLVIHGHCASSTEAHRYVRVFFA